MCFQENRVKAVELLNQYDLSYSIVIEEQEYPSYKALYKWYEEFKSDGNLHKNSAKKAGAQKKRTLAMQRKAL